MTEKIIKFSGIPGAKQYANPLNSTPDHILDFAKGKLNTVLIIGFDNIDGSLYTASSTEDTYELNFMLDMAKKRLLDIPRE